MLYAGKTAPTAEHRKYHWHVIGTTRSISFVIASVFVSVEKSLCDAKPGIHNVHLIHATHNAVASQCKWHDRNDTDCATIRQED